MNLSATGAGAPEEVQEAAALTFGRLFLMPSVRATSSLCHVGAGACAENAKVQSSSDPSFHHAALVSNPHDVGLLSQYRSLGLLLQTFL